MAHTSVPGWQPWIPPKTLPDTGEKEFKVGQVWAFRHDGSLNDHAAVYRVNSIHDGGPRVTTYIQLGANAPRDLGPITSKYWTHHAVLVQDVGCEPIDPDILYQFLYK